MAQSAIVVAVSGQVIAVNTAGQVRPVVQGDRLQAGELVRTAPGSHVELALDDGQSLILGEGRELILGEPESAIAAPAAPSPMAPETVPAPAAAGAQPATPEAQRVIQALEEGRALDAELEEPAAGLGGGAGGQGNAGFVRLQRISENVTPLEYAYATELLSGEPGLRSEGLLQPAVEPPPVEPPVQPRTITVTLGSPTNNMAVTEGGSVVYTVSAAGAVTGSPLVVVLSNGVVITIPVGGSVASSEPLLVRADEAYDQGTQTLTPVTISSALQTAGVEGNFDAIAPVGVVNNTVVDDNDATTVTLSSATNGQDVTEGGSIVYTVSTGSEVKGSPLVVTLSNGVEIVIPVGDSQASSEPVPVRADEAYDQGTQTLAPVTISSAVQTADTVDNFEAIAATGTVNNTVVDDNDTTTVTLSTADVPETADHATFTIVLSNPPQGGAATASVTVTHVDGSTEVRSVAIGADGRGSFDVLFSDDDVYQDGDSVSAVVNSVTGNFEQVDYSAGSAAADIYDVDDTSTVTLSGPDVVQQGGIITYTATVTAPVTEAPLVVTLNNGATITIPIGATSETVQVDLADDVLATQTVQIQNVSGGNYEDLAWTGTVVTDIDSTPSTAADSIGLVEGADAIGAAVLTFITGADAMDPERYAFADPQEQAPTVTGLAAGESLTWVLGEDGRTLTATTSGGDTLVLSLSGESSSGVHVVATLDGNLLHGSEHLVTIDNVVVNAADTDGDLTTGTISLTVAESPTPTTFFTSSVGSTTAVGDIYTGLWTADLGVDETVPTVSDVAITGAKLDGSAATWTFDYDESTGTGSGVLTGSTGTTMPFNFTLGEDGTYTVDLAEAFKQVTITADDYASTINPSGPTDVYTINYVDEDTGVSSSATVTSLARTAPGSTLSLIGKTADGTTTFTATAIGTSINASGSGIGFDNNVMSSYVDVDKHHHTTTLSTESLIFNPEGQASTIVVDFVNSGANGFGISGHDVLYLTLTSDTGATQTIMLDSRYGDFLVNGSTLTPITSTSYAGGALMDYTVTAPDGWGYIAELQATPGFYTAADGDIETSKLKLAFGFTTSTTIEVDLPAQIDFTATVTDADNDTATSNFTLQTYVGASATGTEGSDYIAGTAGVDTVYAGGGDDLLMASPGADTLYGGAGLDTVSYSLADQAVSLDLAAGSATTSEGGLSVTDTLSSIENAVGSAYGDTLTGDSGANTLTGGGGDDALYGGAGLDTASYASAPTGVVVSLAGQGDSTSDSSGGAGSDTLHDMENLTGSPYADTLTGDSGANTISGGAGDDLITGGLGDDELTGGAGADTFDYNAGDSGHDVIHDFTLAHVDEGGDQLDLGDLLTGETYTAENLDNYLSFSTDPVTGHAMITIDANGDGVPDNVQTIVLDNISLADLQAYAGGDSDVAILQKLLDNGNLRKEV